MSTYQILLIILAVIFGISGFIKLKMPKPKLAKSLPWTREFKPATIKFIGFSEFSGAIGLVGPQILGFAYQLTNYAALGICLIMIFAGIYHSRKKEYMSLLINISLFATAFLITFGLIK